MVVLCTAEADTLTEERPSSKFSQIREHGMNSENRHLVERIFQDAQFVQSLGIELTSWGKG